MHDYFTNTKGLTNLIWVYAVVPYFVDQVFDYYPGDAYVDIIGLDYYSWNNDGAVDWNSLYDELRTKGKPFAFSEFGPVQGNVNWDASGGRDARLLIQGIKVYFPDTVYWLSWDDQWEKDGNYDFLITSPGGFHP